MPLFLTSLVVNLMRSYLVSMRVSCRRSPCSVGRCCKFKAIVWRNSVHPQSFRGYSPVAVSCSTAVSRMRTSLCFPSPLWYHAARRLGQVGRERRITVTPLRFITLCRVNYVVSPSLTMTSLGSALAPLSAGGSVK